MTTSVSDVVLEVEDLSVAFGKGDKTVTPVESVSFQINRGEMVGLVGESGSGKSVTSLAVTGLIGFNGGRVTSGSVRLNGVDILAMDRKQRAEILGRDIGMIFQQPTRSLNPTMRVGEQIAEVVRRHTGRSRSEAWARAVEMLDRVHIPEPARRAKNYPHQFSGGMSQRVMIAMALACEPGLLIADEPTTALDVTVQDKVMNLIKDLQEEAGVATLLITHDLGVVARTCDRMAVMYCGQIVETGPVMDVLRTPSHPYTEGLIKAIPNRGGKQRLVAIPGSVPALDALPAGCRFHARCDYAVAGTCDIVAPTLEQRSGPRPDRCLHPHDSDTVLQIASAGRAEGV